MLKSHCAIEKKMYIQKYSYLKIFINKISCKIFTYN